MITCEYDTLYYILINKNTVLLRIGDMLSFYVFQSHQFNSSLYFTTINNLGLFENNFFYKNDPL